MANSRFRGKVGQPQTKLFVFCGQLRNSSAQGCHDDPTAQLGVPVVRVREQSCIDIGRNERVPDADARLSSRQGLSVPLIAK
jgi:hypothetical protein